MNEAFQCVGWYKSLSPEDVGKSTTVSDGAIFSSFEDAKIYAQVNFAQGEVKRIENPTESSVDYDFKINHFPKCGFLPSICNRQFGRAHEFCCDIDDCQHKKHNRR